MLKQWLNIKIFIIILFFLSSIAFAEEAIQKNDFYLDKTEVVLQQIDLLKNRILQANHEYNDLLHKQDNSANLPLDRVNKQWLHWLKLNISAAKSNLDSIDIELSEAQQMTSTLEKDTNELSNEINALNIFGTKIYKNGVPNLSNLRAQLVFQKNLLRLEKERLERLNDLQSIADKILQVYNVNYSHVENLLKSQTMLQLKERQAKNEIDFQQQQEMWLQKLNGLTSQLNHFSQSSTTKDKNTYIKLENEIFYANENINFLYLQMLIVRYHEQIQQLKLSSSRGTSIILLNKVNDQLQALSKQFSRVENLLTERMTILDDRKTFLLQEKLTDEHYLNEVSELNDQYKSAIENVTQLNTDLTAFRMSLDKAMQEELSSRQGLLGFGVKAWRDLGNEMLLVPTLTYEVGKSLIEMTIKSLYNASISWWCLLSILELFWVSVFYFLSRYLVNILRDMPDHARGHINVIWLMATLSQRNLIDVAIIGNIVGFFVLCGVLSQYYRILLDIGLVWLLFKSLIIMAKLCFVETMHDRSNDEVQIYHRLKGTFLFGGVITMTMVCINQLPVIYELKDLFYRLFLLFLAMVSIFLLKSRNVLSGLVLPHIEAQRTYFKKSVHLLSVLIPLALLINSFIGFFGFINFVLTISWYESLFFVVLLGYLMIKGLLGDLVDYISNILITRTKNGWLWTEALLKPIDKIVRIFLFLTAGVILFFLYGWDQQSPVVERLSKLLYYPLANVLGTTITLISVIELIIITSFLCWAARWIREFVYRIMSSRTNDLGIRTSIAILSQYTLIVCGVLIGLRLLGIDIKALTFIASAFALGVGLGLRDIANNFVCGFLLLFERPLRVGDTVSIGDFEGDVVHIGGRAVTIRTFDHMEVLIPNAEIFSKIFTNWTGHDHIIRTVAIIKINRHDDPQSVQSLIYKVLQDHKKVLKEPEPEVFLNELAEGLIEFEVRYYINLSQVKSRTAVRSEVLIAIWEVFEKSGIKPPYPHHEVLVNHNALIEPKLLNYQL